MKQQPLTEEERDLLVTYRIQRVKETLAEADNLIKAGFYNASVNRLYYEEVQILRKNDIFAKTVKNKAKQHNILIFSKI